MMPRVRFFNTIDGQIDDIKTIEEEHMKFYVCGPTVYDRPHIGNARSIVVYDLFYRLFLVLFDRVTYVRNITDVDDKINNAAKEQNITINKLTDKIISFFKEDMSALNALDPTKEPRATDHIKEMITMIESLVEAGHAYVSQGHVLFDVNSFEDYGKLSNRNLDEMISGSRIEVADYKRNPLDFVLWKPSDEDDDESSKFESPWEYNGSNLGRPGWHIECSAMSIKYLGANFDIHGGGADLQFPHHENEIAQSVCANKGSNYANYWVHNGFLTVNGEKMSKSLKNFITVKDLLDKKVKGVVIRFMLLSSHYRKPLDFNDKGLDDARKTIEKFNSVVIEQDLLSLGEIEKEDLGRYREGSIYVRVIHSLADDLNISKALADMHEEVKNIKMSDDEEKRLEFVKTLNFLGFLDREKFDNVIDENSEEIERKLQDRIEAKKNKDYALADKIRNELLEQGIVIEDIAGGGSVWKRR
ncbi:MAG: cysteine--tRNA ligase [Rickettsiales bacterium]|nr:cysteine--tRNA ligase [Rickettsiales bacterium]